MSLPFSYVTRTVGAFIYIGAAFTVATHIQKWLVKDYTSFRDKSALYGKDLQEGEEPSW